MYTECGNRRFLRNWPQYRAGFYHCTEGAPQRVRRGPPPVPPSRAGSAATRADMRRRPYSAGKRRFCPCKQTSRPESGSADRGWGFHRNTVREAAPPRRAGCAKSAAGRRIAKSGSRHDPEAMRRGDRPRTGIWPAFGGIQTFRQPPRRRWRNRKRRTESGRSHTLIA